MNNNFVHVYQCGECSLFGKENCPRMAQTLEMSRISCVSFVPNVKITTPQGEVTAASVTIILKSDDKKITKQKHSSFERIGKFSKN